jgi:hypothetical protein
VEWLSCVNSTRSYAGHLCGKLAQRWLGGVAEAPDELVVDGDLVFGATQFAKRDTEVDTGDCCDLVG